MTTIRTYWVREVKGGPWAFVCMVDSPVRPPGADVRDCGTYEFLADAVAACGEPPK